MANKTVSPAKTGWKAESLFTTDISSGLAIYNTVVDVTAQQGAFSWGFQLALQNNSVPIFVTPSGLHAEAKVGIDTSPAPQDRKIAVFFNANVQNGVAITFKITMTPLDDHMQPLGPAKSWSLPWTTSEEKPATLKGFVPLSKLKDAKDAGDKKDDDSKGDGK